MMHAPDLPRGINETNEKTTYLLGGWVYVILTSTHLPTYLPTCGWSALLPVGRSLPCRQKVNRPAAPNKGSHGTAAVQHLQYSTYRPAPRPRPCVCCGEACVAGTVVRVPKGLWSRYRTCVAWLVLTHAQSRRFVQVSDSTCDDRHLL